MAYFLSRRVINRFVGEQMKGLKCGCHLWVTWKAWVSSATHFSVHELAVTSWEIDKLNVVLCPWNAQ